MEHAALVNLTNLGDEIEEDEQSSKQMTASFAELRDSLRRCGREVASVCSICWEPVEGSAGVTILPCYHAFHASCINSWSATARPVPGCPECRLPY